MGRFEAFIKVIKEAPPFLLPPGSIRAMITVGMLTLVGIVVLKHDPVPDWLIVWAALIIKNYFDERGKNGGS